MSGHSKWAQIKHQKAATDKKKGLAFSKLVRQIVIAAREGGADPNSNFKLRLAVEKARAAEMPKDNIDRAIQKAAGGGENQIENVVYEGFGPFGTSFIVEAATDSKNRTTANIRHIFEKAGGTLGQPNSVAWSFEVKGQLLAEKNNKDMAEIELAAIDAGAEDVRISEYGLEIYTAPLDLHNVKEAVEKAGAKIVSVEIVREATTPVVLEDDQKEKIQELFDTLNDDEDVVAIHTSAVL
jgi:YebC/PmpR family DNA-binding regulatory protein